MKRVDAWLEQSTITWVILAWIYIIAIPITAYFLDADGFGNTMFEAFFRVSLVYVVVAAIYLVIYALDALVRETITIIKERKK